MTVTIRRARSDEAGVLTDLSMRAKRSNGYDEAFMEACRAELTVTAARMESVLLCCVVFARLGWCWLL